MRWSYRIKNSFFGLLFVATAVIMILSGLGIVPHVGIWKLIMSIFFLFLLIVGICNLEIGGILFPAAFLAILYDTELGIEAITPWPVLWAAVFGTVGLSMIFRKKNRSFISYRNIKKNVWEEDCCYEEVKEEYNESEDGEEFISRLSFGSTNKYIDSDSFAKGVVECNFGNTGLYFDKARLKNGHAYLECEVSFGSLDIYVPKEWRVEEHMERTFGKFHSRYNGGSGQQILTIGGEVSFGTVRVHYI